MARGEKAHPGTRQILAEHGIHYHGRARQVTRQDMADPHTYLITMDQSNSDDLRREFGRHASQYRLLDFARQTAVTDVPDPYYTNNFATVYQLVTDGCQGLLETIRQREGL